MARWSFSIAGLGKNPNDRVIQDGGLIAEVYTPSKAEKLRLMLVPCCGYKLIIRVDGILVQDPVNTKFC